MRHIEDTKTQVFIQAYRSFLTAEGEMSIEQITKLYQDMKPSLHKKVQSKDIDIEAFMYSFLRLPPVMHQVKKVIMAQTEDIFSREEYHIHDWHVVEAPARRRKMFFDGDHTLAIFINSVTDLDDVVCLLTAFQLEWNKMRKKFEKIDKSDLEKVQKTFQIDDENWTRITRIWGERLEFWFDTISGNAVDFKVSLLRGAYLDYKKAIQRWFENIIEHTRYKDLRTKPIYFVSSNTHSIVNNMTG